MKNLTAILVSSSLVMITFYCIVGFSERDESYNSPESKTQQQDKANSISKEIKEYIAKHPNPESNSKSGGTVSAGTLKYGYLLPYLGENFWYFDDESYLGGRAFTNNLVKQSILDSYAALKENTDRRWCIMEASNQKGGKMAPHRTHQNGLSIDFMMPLKKDNKPYYEKDYSGKMHYLLTFDDAGVFSEDNDVTIDFDAAGEHILALEKEARKNGLKIKKVIIKIELKDELFASKYGKKLKESGIYFVKGLSKLVNALHDDHYHIDFERV